MRWTRIILGTVGAMLALTPAAHAADFTVTGTADVSGTCTGDQCTSIRAALDAAEQLAGGDRILLAAATYPLSGSALTLNTSVLLQGQGARDTKIVAAPGKRVLEIAGAATISRLTVSGGDAAGGFGGNIFANNTTTTLDHVRVTGGRASAGAGVANLYGTMTIENSLIDANATQTTGAGDLLDSAGGGILNFSGPGFSASALTLRNSTVALNQAYRAGAIISSGNAQNSLTLNSVTVARNVAGTGGTGGIYSDGGLFAAGSSVVADNTITGGGFSDCGGTPASSQGWNVESQSVCGFTQEVDVRNAGAAGLAGTLVNAGGETDVLLPSVDSPAVNLKAQLCEASDQRGVERPKGPKCDAGAVELEYPVRIDSGPRGAITATKVTFTFSSTQAPDEFRCGLSGPSAPTPTYTTCESPLVYDNLADASYTFHVRAIESDTPIGEATRDFTVDTVAPTVTITSIPPSLTSQFTFDIEFSASEPDAAFECRHFWPDDPNHIDDVAPCPSPWSFRELPDGTHRFEITPIDAAGNRGETVAEEVTIDSVVPNPVEASTVDATTFAFTPTEQGAAFECRLEGPASDSGFVPCTSPKAYPDLAPGDYRFTLRTLDAAGNHADANPRAFSVAQSQPAPPTPTPAATATPTPTPTPTPTATPTPTPELAETVVVRPVSGKILVRLPNSTEFVALDATKGFPVGTEIDARKGRIQLTQEPGQGKPVQKSVFYGGIFTINQGSDGFVELKLSEELEPCSKKKKASAAAKKPTSRKLWGDGKGKFRTRGQYSAATIRGTKWLVEDSCAGTLTRVANGVVSVRDIFKKKTLLLRGGKSYLAKPKR